MSPEIERAVQLLRAGELVAFPTETVYGLGADASNVSAVAKIFAVKGRPQDHPLIVHVPGVEHLDRWACEVPEKARALAKAFWPGPLTLILKRRPEVIDAITGGQDTVGIRVPNHPLALELLKAFDGGVAAPSANRFGHVSPTTAQHVHDELGDAVAMILDGGPCQVGIESTIVDLTGERTTILRPGMVSAFELGKVLGRLPAIGGADAPRVSGSLAAHYAPRTPLALLQPDVVIFAVREAMAANKRIGIIAPMACPLSDERIVWRQISGEAAGFAHDIYALLRELDEMGCARIVVQKPPLNENWRAINDRLQRAVAGSGS
ncbi:MAG: threonylcarbamoyl-AMP synthase [Rhodocyclaceae bacterium]|jgi:L-threonylcarbamoyladenylate synthase|nr:threonylcarbamoyl-AMP synthase [Rhodocyclaceae bacterium]MBK6552836.1 threonylcarbamoyl-AMP synthase [Rhodocyclaceae bacterium]MBK9312367.1 threonylcarbamoyl-AMP synthase [Rhodocyclaceae bacterium]MBK9955953.1 threonylcarbamoyl-AMP synthase [Rhodocyclaceae bacterium]